MEEKTLVTIGIPTYNVGRFVALSIKSVLAQTYTNFELIITDDGSTDNTVEEIRQFNDPRIKFFVDGENHGISYRLNQQIDMAKGDIFIRMDGDDLMFITRVEEEVQYLVKHPEVDVVGSSVVVIDDDNKIIGYRPSNNSPLTKQQLYARTCFAHPTACGRTSFFRKHYYRSEYDGAEDFNLWIRGFTGNNYHKLPEPLMFYRDPCTFKLKTYLGRMKKLRKMYREFILSDQENALYIKCLIRKTYIKSILAYTLSHLHLDSLMISRRNQTCDNPDYQKVLEGMLKD